MLDEGLAHAADSVGMPLVYVQPGAFTMGSPEDEPGREEQERQHEVALTQGFLLGVHPVTVGQFGQFVSDVKYLTDAERDGKGGYALNVATGSFGDMNEECTWRSPGFEQADDHPVVAVSWNDGKSFCQWLSQREDKAYRLPTEAEWEYACRGGTTTAYVHGNDPQGLDAYVNFGDDPSAKPRDGYHFTAPVGRFQSNSFGLHDMHGNVWEWCQDWYDERGYTKDRQTDPAGPTSGSARVQRGGGWSSAAKRCRSAARVGRDPVCYRGGYLGFRVALTPS